MSTDEADGLFDRLDGWYEGRRAGTGDASSRATSAFPAATPHTEASVESLRPAAAMPPAAPVEPPTKPSSGIAPTVEPSLGERAVAVAGRVGRRLLAGAGKRARGRR